MSSHPDNKEIVSLRYDPPQGTVFYVDAEIALGCQTTLQRSMSLACPGLCQRHHCLYKWTSTFEMQRIISTRELSELHTLVPKLPLSPSAPEWHIVGCMAPLRLPGSVKDLWKSQCHLAFVCFCPICCVLRDAKWLC